MKKYIIGSIILIVLFASYYAWSGVSPGKKVNYSALAIEGERCEIDFGTYRCTQTRVPKKKGVLFPFKLSDQSDSEVLKKKNSCTKNQVIALSGIVELARNGSEFNLPSGFFIQIEEKKTGLIIGKSHGTIEIGQSKERGKFFCEFQAPKSNGEYLISLHWGLRNRKRLFELPLSVL